MGSYNKLLISMVLLVLGMQGLFAQGAETTDTLMLRVNVREQPLLGKFEPELVVSVAARMALKKKREARAKWTKQVLDTLSISKRKRKKLLRDLRDSPFSDRLYRAVLVHSTFDEDAIE